MSPTYRMLSEVWRDAKRVLRPITLHVNSQEKRIELITGGVIEFWSLTDPDSIRGRKYARVIIDEAAMVRGLVDVWNLVIRPTLTDYRGDAFFLSTPKGRNGFWELFQRGQDSLQSDWASFQMPTVTNPHIDPIEVAAARLEVPELVYTQEYLAQFVDGNGLFRKVMESAIAEMVAGPLASRWYVFGLDWARENDYTVISVVDAVSMEQVYLDRFHQVDYAMQKNRLRALYDLFLPGVILAEANNMGGPLIEVAARGWAADPAVRDDQRQQERDHRRPGAVVRAEHVSYPERRDPGRRAAGVRADPAAERPVSLRSGGQRPRRHGDRAGAQLLCGECAAGSGSGGSGMNCLVYSRAKYSSSMRWIKM